MRVSKKTTYCVALAATMAAKDVRTELRTMESVITESMSICDDSKLLSIDLDGLCFGEGGAV